MRADKEMANFGMSLIFFYGYGMVTVGATTLFGPVALIIAGLILMAGILWTVIDNNKKEIRDAALQTDRQTCNKDDPTTGPDRPSRS